MDFVARPHIGPRWASPDVYLQDEFSIWDPYELPTCWPDVGPRPAAWPLAFRQLMLSPAPVQQRHMAGTPADVRRALFLFRHDTPPPANQTFSSGNLSPPGRRAAARRPGPVPVGSNLASLVKSVAWGHELRNG